MRASAKAASASSTVSGGQGRGPLLRLLATRDGSRGSAGIGAPSFRRVFLLAALAMVACLAFGPPLAAAAAPVPTAKPATEVGASTVQLEGELNPGEQETFCRFDYITDAQFAANVGASLPDFEGAASIACTEPLLGATVQPVSVTLGGLTAATTYHLRFVAANGEGEVEDVAPDFTTDPAPNTPVVALDPATPLYTAADIQGTVDPEGGNLNSPGNPVPIHWTIEVSETGEPETWAEAGSGDISEGPAEESTPVPVSAEAVGLVPGVTYHYRLRATYAGQSVETDPASTFTTLAVAKPTVTLAPITPHTSASAHLSGTIETNAPAGALGANAEAAFKAEWHLSCEPECPNLTVPSGTVEATEASQIISADATGLEPNTTYVVTLEASNAGGAAKDVKSFATDLIPATVKTGVGASDGKGGYVLEGAVNPHNSAVIGCIFKFGLTSSYGQTLPCEGTPGAGNRPVEVTAHPTGLTVGTTYHFQIVATNGAGPEASGDGTFGPTLDNAAAVCPNEAIRQEQGSTYLPECRAYEQVTNPFKQAFVPIFGGYTDKGAVAYTSGGNFAGNGLGGSANQYVATRSEAGWTTAALSPSGPAYAASGGGYSAEALSVDLRSSLWLMRRPEESSDVNDFYLRDADGVFTRVGPGPNPATLPPGSPGTGYSGADAGFGVQFYGASADLSHFVFSLLGPGRYPGDTAQSIQSIYEYSGTGNDRPRLVGVDNAGHQISQGETCLGSQNTSRYHAISTDGRVVFFTPGCLNGEEQVWARINGTTSVEASASLCTRTSTDPGGACNGPANAVFQGADADGSRVYFTTTRQLVNGDTDETEDLYECDIPPGTPAPSGLANPCSALREASGAATGANVEGVTRISDDGSRVYFVASGVLASNPGADALTALSGANNLYVWQQDATHPAGQTTFVARLEPSDSELWGGETGPARMAQTTEDGRYLILSTHTALLPTDTDNAADVYRYDADTGQIVRISTDTSGTGGNTDGDDATFSAVIYPEVNPATRPPRTAMTANGDTIVFLTAEALSPEDRNDSLDVYEWKDGKVSLISGGRTRANPLGHHVWITDSGTDIYFETNERLTSTDGDTLQDIYDARIGGGFSSAATPPCSGEGCQSTSAAPASPAAPATGSSSGSGNFKPKGCPKDKVVKGGRCVKKRHRKEKKHNKHANKKHHGKKAGHKRGGGK